MFGIDFYPTKREIIERMLSGTIIADKVILEPSAGKGNIVDYCNEFGAKSVIACEIDANLRKILSGKCNIVSHDFMDLTAEKISHVNLIIMNPPFSYQEKHIMHAWDIAPAGCQIISLCNSSMVENRYNKGREVINNIISANGHSEKFGDCFSDAERQTGVSVSCVWLYKPGSNDNEFDGYFDLYDYEQEEINQSGIVKYNYIQDIVSRYVEAVSMFDEVEAANIRINAAISGVVTGFNISFGAKQHGRDNEYKEITRDVFKKELQKAAWKHIFGFMKMDKYVTTGVKATINKFVEQQIHVPFTVRNVYLMLHMIEQTHGQRMDKVVCEAFDRICSLAHENCTAGEGWRTNTDFLINKRFILPYITEINYHGGGLGINHHRSEILEDVVKALCYLSGKDYEKQPNLRLWFHAPYHIICDGQLLTGYENCASRIDDYSFKKRIEVLRNNGHEVTIHNTKTEWGKWTEWTDFFLVRGYKKGTMHVEFKDEELWLKFNQKVAEIRGWKNMVVHTTKGRSKKSK